MWNVERWGRNVIGMWLLVQSGWCFIFSSLVRGKAERKLTYSHHAANAAALFREKAWPHLVKRLNVVPAWFFFLYTWFSDRLLGRYIDPWGRVCEWWILSPERSVLVFFFFFSSSFWRILHDSEVIAQLSDFRVPETGTFDNITSSFYGIHFVCSLCFRADIN